MKKIANFIGFGTLATFALAGTFFVIYSLVNLGNVFDMFDFNGGYAFCALMNLLLCLGCIAVLLVFFVFEILKMIPVFAGKDVENKSLVHMNTVVLFALGVFFFTLFFTFIECGILGAKVGGQVIVAFILTLSGLAAVVVGLVVKNFAPLLKVIFALAGLFMLLVVGFFFFQGADGLFLVYLIFQMIGVFGGMGYLVLANLDAFKK